ncbi:MAG: hypothetical protein HZA51_17450 [Planctomycetes bacterium]|nr:hypothetical protein [Planctomycetota bacterium]
MPRTPWTALAFTLLTTPCFGGLIAVAPAVRSASTLDQSFRVDSPTASLQAAAIVRTFGNMHDAWHAAPVIPGAPTASITNPAVPTQRRIESPSTETTSPVLHVLPTVAPTTPSPSIPLSRASSKAKVGVPRKQTPIKLASQRTIPEPIMFAFVAFMAPILRPRRATRLAPLHA